MPIANNLKVQIDLPVWEWLRTAPLASSAISCSCVADNTNFHEQHGRYIYYLISAVSFWRYDTWTDTYLQLASPPTAPLVWSSMRFMGNKGFDGKVLSATAGGATIPAYAGKALRGFDIRIVGGTGDGQRRVITDVTEATVHDTGVPTAASTTTITDTTKAWTINQWAGYQVRITFGTGVSQVRRILYNGTNTLVYNDVNKYPEDNLCNPAPLVPALVVTAGAQSIYSIESATITVDSNWSVTPDATSRFRISSGAIMLFSSAAASPFYTAQMYDVLSDTWYIKTAQTLNMAVVGTDGTLERATENATVWERGIATAGTTTTLTDSTKDWTVNEWAGKEVFIFSGTGVGQIRTIISNTATALTFAVGTAPDATSRYMIQGFDAGIATSGAATTITDTTKAWTVDRWKNFAVRILHGTGSGQIQQIRSNTATALTVVRPWVTNPDATSVYEIIGDTNKQYLMMGNNASVLMYNLDSDLASFGREEEDGVARIGSAQYADWRPVAIATTTRSGTTATVTTVAPHSFKTGWTLTMRGASDALYNISAVITVTGANTFTYTMAGTPGANAVFIALSTTVLVDASKTWTVNEWAGYICYMGNTIGAAPVGQAMQIVSNTANTLTFSAVVTIPANGVTRYLIAPRTVPGAIDHGIATGTQSTTTLQDTSKAWVVNIHAGRRVKFLSGAGQSQELLITSNTANTLTFAAATAPVAASTSYAILQQAIRGVGIELNWAYGLSDASMAGKYLFISRGGGLIGFDRLDITTDQWLLMTTSPQSETLSTGSMFAYDGGDRMYFTKENTMRVYYLNLVTNGIRGAGIYPYIAGTATVGNRMEIFKTADGIKFLWLNRHSAIECYRQMMWY